MKHNTLESTQTLSQPISDPLNDKAPRTALVAHTMERTEVIILEADKPVIVGRAPVSGIGLHDANLSREHARFTLTNGRVNVEDLGSKNGTFLAGRRVEKAVLDMGDDVVLGAVRIRVQLLGEMGQPLGIEGEERFRRHLEEEVSRALEFRRPFAFVVVRVVDKCTGAPVPQGVSAWLDQIRHRVRSVDRLGLHGQDAVQIILPETSLPMAENLAHALVAPVASLEIAFLVGVAMHPGVSLNVDELIAFAHQAARRASLEKPIEIFRNDSGILGDEESNQGEIVAGPKMREVLDVVTRVASSRLPVILSGETGTGKEVIARLIHEHGHRKDKRMVRVNCGAIPKDLVESTLFGHERGAFTGALQQQKGVFEDADGGTVFLDEIGELPLSAQVALLRVLETGCFVRVGSTREIAVDVRVVAATHRNLEAMAEEGTFRADLYYRLGGITIDIPSLAARSEDIEPLARRFLRLANENNGRNVQGFAPEAVELMRLYDWPGNVRELRNAIERAVVVTRGALIGPEDLPGRMRNATRQVPVPESNPFRGADSRPGISQAGPTSPASEVNDESGPVRGKVQQYEANVVRDVLVAAGWNRIEAAKQMGIPVRTLSYRMKVLGIKKPEA